MKPAVFQVYESDGSVRLLCFYMRSFAATVDLDKTLCPLSGPHIDVKLLGRFHRIQMATSTEEALAFVPERHGSVRRETLTVLKSVRDGQ
jgi:hypothetical protein